MLVRSFGWLVLVGDCKPLNVCRSLPAPAHLVRRLKILLHLRDFWFAAVFGHLTGLPLRPKSVDSPRSPVRLDQSEFEDFFFQESLLRPIYTYRLLQSVH